MTGVKHESQLRPAALEQLIREDEAVVVGPSRGPVTIDSKYTVIVGTSGSTDYLRDETAGQRFWSVAPGPSPLDPVEICDGIHDEDAPPQYLCTRCFPNGAAGGDLAAHEDNMYDEVRRDDEQEME